MLLTSADRSAAVGLQISALLSNKEGVNPTGIINTFAPFSRALVCSGRDREWLSVSALSLGHRNT